MSGSNSVTCWKFLYNSPIHELIELPSVSSQLGALPRWWFKLDGEMKSCRECTYLSLSLSLPLHRLQVSLAVQRRDGRYPWTMVFWNLFADSWLLPHSYQLGHSYYWIHQTLQTAGWQGSSRKTGHKFQPRSSIYMTSLCSFDSKLSLRSSKAHQLFGSSSGQWWVGHQDNQAQQPRLRNRAPRRVGSLRHCFSRGQGISHSGPKNSYWSQNSQYHLHQSARSCDEVGHLRTFILIQPSGTMAGINGVIAKRHSGATQSGTGFFGCGTPPHNLPQPRKPKTSYISYYQFAMFFCQQNPIVPLCEAVKIL